MQTLISIMYSFRADNIPKIIIAKKYRGRQKIRSVSYTLIIKETRYIVNDLTTIFL